MASEKIQEGNPVLRTFEDVPEELGDGEEALPPITPEGEEEEDSPNFERDDRDKSDW